MNKWTITHIPEVGARVLTLNAARALGSVDRIIRNGAQSTCIVILDNGLTRQFAPADLKSINFPITLDDARWLREELKVLW